MTVSAHVLDGVRGGPVAGVGVRLDRKNDRGEWEVVIEGAALTIGGVARDDLVELGSEERRVGKECCTPCRSRWSPYH